MRTFVKLTYFVKWSDSFGAVDYIETDMRTCEANSKISIKKIDDLVAKK